MGHYHLDKQCFIVKTSDNHTGSGTMADGRTITASTGFPELDQALGGVDRGDNVVWEAEKEDVLEPFYRVIAAGADEYDEAAYVTLAHEPDAVRDAYPSSR